MRWSGVPRVLTLVWIVMAASAATVSPGRAAQGNTILFISSFSPAAAWTGPMLQAIEAEHAERGWPAELKFEFLNAWQPLSPSDITEWTRLLTDKYRNTPPRVILADGFPTGALLTAGDDRLFPGVPIIGVQPGPVELGRADLLRNALLRSMARMENTVGLALDLLPDTRTIVVIGDRTGPSQYFMRLAKQFLGKPAFDPLKRVFLDDYRLEDMEDQLARLPDNTIVLFTLVFQDNTGRRFRPDYAIDRLSQASSVPIFGLFEPLIGNGIVGGHVASPALAGRISMRAALAVLENDPSALEPLAVENADRIVFDWNRLQRWNLDISRIPADAEIRFQPPPLWEAYFWQAVTGLAFIGVLAVALIGTTLLYLQRSALTRALRDANTLLETRVAERTIDLERANQAKSAFLAHMSHEIRTPMNVILNMVRLARRSPPGKQGHAYLDSAEAASRMLLSLLNDVLDLSKVEMGRIDLESVEFEVAEMAANLVAVTAHTADEKGLALIIKVAPNVPERLVGDPLRLGQVLMNLTSNAVKFTERGDVVVTVEVDRLEVDRVSLRGTVSDTGIGIDKAQLTRLFEPFSQGDSSVTRRYGGSGLGLAISRQLVNLMGGDLHLDSTPGIGTTATFTARLVRAREAPLPAATDTGLTGCRILVVDNQPTARTVLTAMLERLGGTVETLGDGETLISAMHDAFRADIPFDLVMLDPRLPGQDGLDILAQMRSDTALGTTPAILMLGVMEHSRQAEADLAGLAEGILVKPVLERPLRAVLHKVLHLQPVRPDSPIADGDADRVDAATQATWDQAAWPGRRVLVVDDVIANRLVVEGLLAETGIVVESASCASDALDRLRTASFDLVFMDIRMPDIDGLTAARAIRDELGLKNLPIIATTAHATTDDIDRSLAAGLNGHLAKPIVPAVLFATLHRFLGAASVGSRSGRATPERKGGGTVDLAHCLNMCGGSLDLMLRYLESVQSLYGDAAAALDLAVQAENRKGIVVLLHNFKTLASTLGSWSLETAVRNVRCGLDDGDVPIPASACHQVSNELNAVLREVSALLRNRSF